MVSVATVAGGKSECAVTAKNDAVLYSVVSNDTPVLTVEKIKHSEHFTEVARNRRSCKNSNISNSAVGVKYEGNCNSILICIIISTCGVVDMLTNDQSRLVQLGWSYVCKMSTSDSHSIKPCPTGS
jgi:hypothetical protein